MKAVHSAFVCSCLMLVSTQAMSQKQDIAVTVDGSNFGRGSDIAVNVGLLPLKTKRNLPRKLPRGYSNPTAFYMACTAKNEASSWNNGLGAEVFCDLKDEQTKIAQSKAEEVDDIASGSNSHHTFSEKLSLPENPEGTKLWIITRLDYDFPGLPAGDHKSLYGSTYLIYRCDHAGSGKADLVSCGYYTPGGYTIHKVGNMTC